MHLVWWRKAVNDNEHPIYRVLESPGLNQFIVAEMDGLGPIMRLGPYASRHHALDRMNALLTLVADRGLDRRPGGRARS
jgi:hypothetical protein